MLRISPPSRLEDRVVAHLAAAVCDHQGWDVDTLRSEETGTGCASVFSADAYAGGCVRFRLSPVGESFGVQAAKTWLSQVVEGGKERHAGTTAHPIGASAALLRSPPRYDVLPMHFQIGLQRPEAPNVEVFSGQEAGEVSIPLGAWMTGAIWASKGTQRTLRASRAAMKAALRERSRPVGAWDAGVRTPVSLRRVRRLSRSMEPAAVRARLKIEAFDVRVVEKALQIHRDVEMPVMVFFSHASLLIANHQMIWNPGDDSVLLHGPILHIELAPTPRGTVTSSMVGKDYVRVFDALRAQGLRSY